MKTQIVATLEKAKAYTLDVAGLMPEEAYSFKPATPVWNFNELVHHIGYGIYWWQETYIRQTEMPWDPPPVTTSKTATLTYLEEAFADLLQTVKGSPESDELSYAVQATLDHITHHRGQATVYLRCQGITPPEYIF